MSITSKLLIVLAMIISTNSTSSSPQLLQIFAPSPSISLVNITREKRWMPSCNSVVGKWVLDNCASKAHLTLAEEQETLVVDLNDTFS